MLAVEEFEGPWIFTDRDGNTHEIVDSFFSECISCGNVIQVMFKEDESLIYLCDTKDCEVNSFHKERQ
jgi:hypothetical protein